MKYRFENVLDCGYGCEYYDSIYNGHDTEEFEAENDEAAIKYAEQLQDECDNELISVLVNKKGLIDENEAMQSEEFSMAPSFEASLVRIDIDEDGDEVEIPRDEWDI